MLYVNHFFSVRAPGQRAVGVGGGERRMVGENPDSIGLPHPPHLLFISLHLIYFLLSFASLGLGDYLLLLLPNCASHSSLTLSFCISQRELEGLHSLFLFSYFEKGKDTKGSSWLFNYQKQMIFPLDYVLP